MSGGLGVPPERPTAVSAVVGGAVPPTPRQFPGKPKTVLSLDWRRPDCLALLALLAIFAAAMIVKSLSAVPIDQACPASAERVALIAEKIDPNTASAASLRRLPGLGPKRAAAIVAYRQEQAKLHTVPTSAAAGATIATAPPVFHYLEDLEKVYGLGPKTVAPLRGHVSLPSRTNAPPAEPDEEE